MDALQKEMEAFQIAFKVWEHQCQTPSWIQKDTLTHVVDVKMDFTWKAQYVAGGHQTDPPKAR